MTQYYTRLPVMLKQADMKHLNIILSHLGTTNKTEAIRHALQVEAGRIACSTLADDLEQLLFEKDEDDE